MSIPVTLLAALGGSGLAGAVLLGMVALDGGRDRSSLHADPPCNDAAKITQPAFYSEMCRVNARMHRGMEIAPSGDADRDFARMMIAHHQGAIDMARVQLKYGADTRLKRLAQSIIVEQGQEITYMLNLLERKQTLRSEAV